MNSIGNNQNTCEPGAPVKKMNAKKSDKILLPNCTHTSFYQDVRMIQAGTNEKKKMSQPFCHCATGGWQLMKGVATFAWKNFSIVYQSYTCVVPETKRFSVKPTEKNPKAWTCTCSDLASNGNALYCTKEILAAINPATQLTYCGCPDADSISTQSGHPIGAISECF